MVRAQTRSEEDAMRRSRLGSIIATVAIAASMTACASSGASSAPSSAASAPAGSAAAGSVAVELSEWQVVPASASASAGSVTFAVANKGTMIHEFVVVKTDLKADALPVVDHKIDESTLTPVDEIEDIEVAATPSLTVDLTAGHYVLLCNIETHTSGHARRLRRRLGPQGGRRWRGTSSSGSSSGSSRYWRPTPAGCTCRRMPRAITASTWRPRASVTRRPGSPARASARAMSATT